MPRGRKPGSPKFGGRQKGTPNKITIVREIHRFYTAEAIEALRSVCVDNSADEMARVQAACKLIDLLPSELLRTKGVLPCGHQDLTNAIDGCPKTVKTEGAPGCGRSLMPRPRRRMLLDNGICFDVNVMVRAGLRTGTCRSK